MTRRLLPALALLGLLAGCGGTTVIDSGSGPGDSSDAPAAGDYVATDLPAPFRKGDLLRLQVTADGIGWSATCNSFSGQATWDGGTLRTSALGGTEMGCEPDAMEQDQWLVDLLGDAPAYATDGSGFTLTSGDVVLSLRPRAEAIPDRSLEGTTWTLDGFGDGQAVSSVPARASSTLRLEDGRLTLELPCNGTPEPAVEVSDAELVVEGYATTEMSCGKAADTVESAVTAVVRGTVGYRIEEATLTLTGADGGQLTYRAE